MLSTFFKPIILQRPFCAIAGVLGGLLLTQAVNYELLLNSGNSFASQTYQQWQKDTGMTREEIDAALAITVEQNLIQVDTSTQKHYPELIRFRINHGVVDAKLSAIGEVVETSVEPEKEESVEPIKETAEQLPLSIAGSGGELVLSNPTPVKAVSVTNLNNEQINEIFLPVYLKVKHKLWTVHESLPGRAIGSIRRFIKEKKYSTIDKAVTAFVGGLTWLKECEDGWYRDKKLTLSQIMSDGKMADFIDCHEDAMDSDPSYRARVLGESMSADIGKVLPDLDRSEVKKAQAALDIYTKQQEATPTIIIHEDTGSLWR